MQEMHDFCRPFTSIEQEGNELRIEIRVTPDRQQGPDAKTLAVVACSSFDDLGVCLDGLGANGLSRFVNESDSGPVTEHVLSTAAKLLDYVRTNRPSTLTLVASDTSAQGMSDRIHRLETRPGAGIRIRRFNNALEPTARASSS